MKESFTDKFAIFIAYVLITCFTLCLIFGTILLMKLAINM